jgi:hypothetical protein
MRSFVDRNVVMQRVTVYVYVPHIHALRCIYTYVVNLQMHMNNISFIVH